MTTLTGVLSRSEPHAAFQFIDSISNVKRFDMVVMFLDGKEKAGTCSCIGGRLAWPY